MRGVSARSSASIGSPGAAGAGLSQRSTSDTLPTLDRREEELSRVGVAFTHDPGGLSHGRSSASHERGCPDAVGPGGLLRIHEKSLKMSVDRGFSGARR